MRSRATIIAFLAFLSTVFIVPAQNPILHKGHAHNDYENRRPLFYALENGFRSLEIDIFGHKDEVVVSHIPLLLDTRKNIVELYLEPLKKIIDANGGTVYKGDSSTLILYIDLKNHRYTGRDKDEASTYELLKKTVEPYFSYLKLWYGDSVRWGPIELLIDGYADRLQAESPRWASVQLGWEDYAQPFSPALAPRLNGNYRKLFKWRGSGEMPAEEEAKLKELLKNAHAYGRTVRLYAATNKVKVWRKLMDCGADWINVDNLKKFYRFNQKYMREKLKCDGLD